MPFLRTESAPHRMTITGDVKLWKVDKIADLCTLSDLQLKEKAYCENWLIAPRPLGRGQGSEHRSQASHS